jgi:hypothetical protein
MLDRVVFTAVCASASTGAVTPTIIIAAAFKTANFADIIVKPSDYIIFLRLMQGIS